MVASVVASKLSTPSARRSSKLAESRATLEGYAAFQISTALPVYILAEMNQSRGRNKPQSPHAVHFDVQPLQ